MQSWLSFIFFSRTMMVNKALPSVASSENLPLMILAVWQYLRAYRRYQFLALVLLMILASFAEVFSIGAIVPFLAALTAPELVFNHPMAQLFIQILNIESPQQIVLPTAIIFGTAALIAGIIRVLLLYTTTRFSYAVGADLSLDMYRRSLYQPYIVHTTRNSSELITGITGKSAVMTGSILVPLLNLSSSFFLLGGILLALFALNPIIAIVACAFFGIIYSIILAITKKKLQHNSACIARESTQVIKSLQEGFGGIREVLIDATQEIYCRIYQKADRPLRLAQGRNTFISASPRFFIETVGLIMIAGFAYSMSLRPGGVSTAIPVLGALALGAQRLLPILQQSYASISIIRGAKASMQDVLELLGQPLPADIEVLMEPMLFKNNIELVNVNFQYGPVSTPILKNINIRIPKGKKIGFMGATGSGKSTLLDILMSLHEPNSGNLKVDGAPVTGVNRKGWRALIAHVPQTIYLSDSSIAENIALSVPAEEIDLSRVQKAAEQAQISQSIEAWPEQYQTKVGERGVRLSGGQLQRIGIARALYKKASVLIFDEATSALDVDTEKAVMDAIDGLDREMTILIIAHRLSTLKNCDQIVELANGCVKRQGTYNDLVNS